MRSAPAACAAESRERSLTQLFRTPNEESPTDEIVELEFELAEWGRLWFLVRAITSDDGEGSNSASGNLQIVSFVDVRDSGGAEVAVTNICAESGTEY